MACAVVPLLAISTTLGLCNFLGNRTNSLMLIMPFLIMGIGVNDSFLTVHAWLRQPLRTTEAERLGQVLREVGPSITTTTLTNVVTFMIGWLTPTEGFIHFLILTVSKIFRNLNFLLGMRPSAGICLHLHDNPLLPGTVLLFDSRCSGPQGSQLADKGKFLPPNEF